MSFTEFQNYQNEVRQMLWQERFREESLDEAVRAQKPLSRTMHLTYPTTEDEEDMNLVVVVESNG